MNAPPGDSSIGTYRILRSLGSLDSTFLCLDDAGRRVVLKRLESDCLLGPRLHPSIKERLMRVRELAQRNVATLHTVERTSKGDAWLVWDYIAGQTFEEVVNDLQRLPSPRQRANLARELMLSVDALHSLGLVHGSLHGRNVIVAPDGQLHLTHINPLLYSDPADDTMAIATLLKEFVPLTAIDPQTTTLRQLAAGLAATESSDQPSFSAARSNNIEPGVRRRSLVAAACITLVSIVISAVIYRAATRPRPSPVWENVGRLDTTSIAR
jgi:hypothetical protein